MAATFKVGDKVEHRTWGAGEIAFGPFLRSRSTDNYLMVEADGEHRFVESEAMTPAAKFKVGDTVRSITAKYTVAAGPFRGPSHTWYVITKDGVDYQSRELWLSLVEATPDNTYTHDGITYDLTARYRDNDGDYWTFKDVDGTVRGSFAGIDVDLSDHISEYSDTLTETVAEYGPLTRV